MALLRINQIPGKEGATVCYFFDLDGASLWIPTASGWRSISPFCAVSALIRFPRNIPDYVTHHTFHDAAVYTRDIFRLSLAPEEIISIWRDMARQAYPPGVATEAWRPGIFIARPQGRDPLRPFDLLYARALPGGTGTSSAYLPALPRSLTTAELALEKRDPALYRHVARSLEQSPEHCVLFDDSPVYCQAARQAGWRVFGVADPAFAHRAGELYVLPSAGHRVIRSSSISRFPEIQDHIKKAGRYRPAFVLGATYFPSPSPGKYLRQKRA